jgi:hypothetical protein
MYKDKYLKYKKKYLQLKSQSGGGFKWVYEDDSEPIPEEIQQQLEAELNEFKRLNKQKKYTDHDIINFNNWTYNKKEIFRIEEQDKKKSEPKSTLGLPNSFGRESSMFSPKTEPQPQQRSIDYYYNQAMDSFGIDFTLTALHTFLSAYPGSAQVSVGSGNAVLEYSYAKRFTGSKETIICVDPEPLSYNSRSLKTPFQNPKYRNVTELLSAEPKCKNNCVLILNWALPDESMYDFDAVTELNPQGFFTTVEYWRGGHGCAGGRRFHEFLGRTKSYVLVHRVSLDYKQFSRRGQNICIEWWHRSDLLPIPKHTLPISVESKLENVGGLWEL